MATISVSLPSDGTTADVADYNTPITTVVNAINGNLDNTNIASGAAISGSKIADNSIDIESKASADTGWREVTDSWTYASATTITVPTDATTKYSVGDKIRLTQSTVKYFYITGVTTTILTINGGTDYTLTNAAISDISYSKACTPVGFPQTFAWTPTWANWTIGSATVDAKFSMTGKVVNFRIAVTLSSTTVGTAPTFTLPVTSVTVSAAMANMPLGTANVNTGAGAKNMWLKWASTTTCRLMTWDLNNDEGNVTSTIPTTWANGYTFIGQGTYEAA